MNLCQNTLRPTSRREMLSQCSMGFGALALASLWQQSTVGETTSGIAARMAQVTPRAKRIIFLFMQGGPSQVDTFDYKPLLARDHGKEYPYAKPRVQFAGTESLMNGVWKFQRHGQSGAWVSELLPHIAGVVDELCFLKGMCGSNPAHGGAMLKIHTGSDTFVRPSMGSWLTYGLGSENESLPGYITICPTLTHGGVNNWSSAFMPAEYHGTPIGHRGIAARDATIPFLQHESSDLLAQRQQLDLIARMNARTLARTGPQHALESRIQSFELAFRMQTEAPGALSLEGESKATMSLYGIDDEETEDFGRQCLLARRLSERGVRFVQCNSGGWDHHDELKEKLPISCRRVDKPVAGLIRDLRARGLLDETLVLWGGEFGRTPCSQVPDLPGARSLGRDHNPDGFTMFMAGGGVQPGMSYGATDEYGFFARENRVSIHDWHATILHLMGIDHERLTYRYQGRDFRLTDVAGRVLEDILI